jgi:predicted nucleotidyltransferase
MLSLTQNERQALLILFKDFTHFYNANSLSKVLKMSHVGVQKICKRLLNEHLVVSKRIGNAIVYKPNLNNEYVHQLIVFLLADEANNFKRWKEEFRELKNNIVMMFGSAVMNYAKARDIDLMIVLNKKDVKKVSTILKRKKDILPKKVHAIKLTNQDLLENVKKKDKAMVDIVRNAIILYGQDKYVEILKHVTGF